MDKDNHKPIEVALIPVDTGPTEDRSSEWLLQCAVVPPEDIVVERTTRRTKARNKQDVILAPSASTQLKQSSQLDSIFMFITFKMSYNKFI